MFSGGLLSRNLGRTFGSRQVNNPAEPSKNDNKKKPTVKLVDSPKLQDKDLMNWSESKRKGKNNPNLRPTYSVEVKGRIRFVSPAGGMVLLGVTVLVISSLMTWLARILLFGPIGIGLGIYIILMAITLLLEDRNESSMLYHIQDIYTNYLIRGPTKTTQDKAVQVEQPQDQQDLKSCIKSQLKETILSGKIDEKEVVRPLLNRQNSTDYENDVFEKEPEIFEVNRKFESPRNNQQLSRIRKANKTKIRQVTYC